MKQEKIKWDGKSDLANKMFGESYGIDCNYIGKTSNILVMGRIIKVGEYIKKK